MTKDKFLEITKYLSEIIKGTEFENHTFCVGGSVRDYIMDNPIKDIDIVIDLEHGGINFANYLKNNGYTTGSVVVYPTFGTAMFHLNQFPDEEIESVYTRGEKYVSGSRNPETKFASIEEDCFRRDLTINALYYNVSNGEILDLTGKGLNDIKNQYIRVTNDNPDIVFKDDPLRILRAIRFSLKYGYWKIDEKTYESMKRNIDGLSFISQERITSEFNKILTSEDVSMALWLLDDLNCFKYIFGGDFGQMNITGDVELHVVSLPQNLEMRLAALLSNNEFYFIADKILRQMKYSNEIINKVKTYHHFQNYHMFDAGFDREYLVSKFQYECKTRETFDNVIEYLKMYWMSSHGFLDEFVTFYSEAFNGFIKIGKEKNMFQYKLPVDGNDIMEILGSGPSDLIGEIIDKLLEKAFFNNDITREECIKFITGCKN